MEEQRKAKNRLMTTIALVVLAAVGKRVQK